MENPKRADPDIKDKQPSGSNVLADQNNNEIITFQHELRDIFSNYSKNFNVVHINAQSIPKHYLSFLATFVNLHNVDAVLVSETFLKQSMNSKAGDIPGYNLIRNDRVGKGCGGVAIYLRKELKYKHVAKSLSYYTSSAEYIFIEVYHNKTKILLGVFYSPNSTINYFSTLEDLFKKYRSDYKYVNILGDFNTDILKANRRVDRLFSIIKNHSLYLPPLGPTHFSPGTKASALDLIIVSEKDIVAKHGQLGSGFSYHDMIYVSNKIKPWRRRPKLNEEPIWQKVDAEAALSEQRRALSIYKQSERVDDDLMKYRNGRKSIEKLEKEFQREKSKIQKSPKK
ncbi:PREDICTED: uncharacterized protein LOC106114098 [Papilio xuthus]|uniref:Uncharacterized protein LOC106114098 n=1 Tax=Papilio xuthus TaxID=66420 RepID=A0AAJ6Z0I5_PAPXU|nr:PREDICTED: uncharacterized protein LOC106114098 [Papilio xuthus]